MVTLLRSETLILLLILSASPLPTTRLSPLPFPPPPCSPTIHLSSPLPSAAVAPRTPQQTCTSVGTSRSILSPFLSGYLSFVVRSAVLPAWSNLGAAASSSA
ncbi:unnamed protein product [Closterium sp. NIES-54]